MTLEIGLVLALLAAAILLFALEWLSVDVVTLLVLLVLIVSGTLTPQEAFSGFANDIIIVLCSIFVLSKALLETGVMESLASLIGRFGGRTLGRLRLTVMAAVAAASSFMNNTTATAVFLPGVLGACRKLRLNPGGVLIPLAFASVLGGTCTLIGTSTNVAVSGYLQKTGLPPLSLFEFLPVGLILVVTGLLFVSLLGRRLLPGGEAESFTEQYEMKQFLSEARVEGGPGLSGRPLDGTPIPATGVTVLEVARGRERRLADARTALQGGDVLIVKGPREALLRLGEVKGLKMLDHTVRDRDLVSRTISIAEALVSPRSSLIGRTLTESNLRGRYGVTALALYRKGHAFPTGLRKIPLEAGDVILLQGSREQFGSLWREGELWLLDQSDYFVGRRRKGLLAVGAFVGGVVLAGTGWLPLSAAFLLAALAVVVTRCLTVEEAYQFIDWRLVVLIAGMTSVGLALEKTGAAGFVAGFLVDRAAPLGPVGLLAAFGVATIVLTQPMSNAAAALVMLPVAVTTAGQIGADPRSFAVMVALSASVSFVTPFEPSSILVYSAGKYRFRDFVRVGLPLTVLDLAILLLLVPYFWPLFPAL